MLDGGAERKEAAAMPDLKDLISEALELDREASEGPWEPQWMHDTARVGQTHMHASCICVAPRYANNGEWPAGPDARLIAKARTGYPLFAKMLEAVQKLPAYWIADDGVAEQTTQDDGLAEFVKVGDLQHALGRVLREEKADEG